MVIIVYLLVGVVFLYMGGEALVHGAHRTALRMGVTSLVAGLVVVSASTSMPEAVSSIIAQVKGGLGDVAIGNILGSNIANVGLILGIACIVKPIRISHVMAAREMPIMIVSLLVMTGLMWGERMSWPSGIIFIALLLAYIVTQFILGRREHRPGPTAHEKVSPWIWTRDLTLIIGGALALVIGGYSLVEGAVGLGRIYHIDERILGLLIVAIGSSLPELASTTVAALRGKSDLAIGNIIGSNVFNALMITGIVCLIAPVTFTRDLLMVDAPVMIAFSLILWAMTLMDTIGRRSGALLVILYGCYVAFGIF